VEIFAKGSKKLGHVNHIKGKKKNFKLRHHQKRLNHGWVIMTTTPSLANKELAPL